MAVAQVSVEAQIQSLAWELLHAVGAAKKKKKKEKQKQQEQQQQGTQRGLVPRRTPQVPLIFNSPFF